MSEEVRMTKGEYLMRSGIVILMLSLCTTRALGGQVVSQWNLATSDTSANIRVMENRIQITQLTNPDARHSWAGEGITVPLMAKVWVGQQECPTAWGFDHGKWDGEDGTLTLSFANREPRLMLRSTWRARPGHGPIEQKASARRAGEIYKKWIRPILKDAKVHHILPRPDGVHWDGMFYWSPSLNRGTVYLFRPKAPENEQVVKLKGLELQKEYRVWCEDGSITPGTRTGKTLMSEGLTVRLPQEHMSDLIYLQDTGAGSRNDE